VALDSNVVSDQPARARQRQATTGLAVAVIVKTRRKESRAADAAAFRSLAARGFVTEANKNGADYPAIMDQTGHTSQATVHGHNRRKKKWEKPASARLSLLTLPSPTAL
jgi:hypothetical protein